MPGNRWAKQEPPVRPADKAVRRANLHRVVRLFRPYRRRLTGLLALIVFTGAVGIVPAFLLRDALTALFDDDKRQLTILVGAIVLINIGTGALGVAQTLLSNQVGQRVMHALRVSVSRHLQRLPLAFSTRPRTGEVQSRISNHIGGVQSVVTNTATSIVSNATTVLATTVAMAILDWRLTLASFAILPLFVWMTRRVGNERRRIAK